MRRPRFRERLRVNRESGQATTEFALIFIPLITVVAGIIYFGIGLNHWLDMNLVAEALSTGAVASPQVIRHSKRMVARDFSGASFTAALRHKDAAYAVRLAEELLPGVPVSRAALAAYEEAKASAPDDDEGKMIEIVSRPK